ncbi:MAG: hypothetical protein ACYTF6_01090 [Planctomycetota bacterium]|jgi:hypothetical protein
MKRRVILLVGSFAALLAAFFCYWCAVGFSVGRGEPTDPGKDPFARFGDSSVETNVPVGDGQVEPRRGEELFIKLCDDQGRVERIYKASVWDKVEGSEDTYRLEQPEAWFYLKDGQIFYARSETGTLLTDPAKRNRPRWLSLAGKVQFDIDRGTGPGLPPLPERPRDHVRILMDRVRFDNKLLTIQSSSEVELYSSEADVFGQGLSIKWKEAPRELEELKIPRGRRIVLKEIPEQLKVVSSTGAKKTRPEAVEKKPVPEESPQRPQEANEVHKAEGTTRSARPETKEKDQAVSNVYLAELINNVRVLSGDGSVNGADRLNLKFQWQRQPRREEQEVAPRRTEPRAGGEAAEAAKPAAEPAGQTMIIEWDGPLVLRPVGRVEKPSNRNYSIEASGEEVVIADSQTTATCQKFVFVSSEKPDGAVGQQAILTGSQQKKASLTMSDGLKVVCPRMRFDRRSGKAHLDGPGYMINAAERARKIEKADGGKATSDAARTQGEEVERITWRDSVVATIFEKTVRLKDGKTRTRQYIKDALFRGKVELTQTVAGKTAKQQQASSIEADTVRIEFEEVESKAAAGKAGSSSKRTATRTRSRPAMLEAEGSVKVTVKRKDRTVTADAHRLESNLKERSAILYGWPAEAGRPARRASIVQGPESLFADEIRLYQITDAAGKTDLEVRVNRPGRLDFLTEKDLDGHKLAKPRKISIAWSKSMSYRGQLGVAEFFGNVKLDSGNEHMGCQTMSVLFGKEVTKGKPEEKSEAAKAAAEKAGTPESSSRSLVLSMEQYSKRPIKIIRSDGAVVMWRRLEDEKKRLLRRQQVRCEHLIYYAEKKRLYCPGPGNMVAEDYEKPDEKKEAASTGGTETAFKADRPSQTALEWHKVMDFLQDDRRVFIEGDVTMRHRSGNKVIVTKGLTVPDWGKLKRGRGLDLRAEKLMVEFYEPPKRKKAEPSGPGPRLGTPKRFSATRSVHAKDGPWRVIAERVIYDRPPDPDSEAVIIWGFLKGQPVGNAELSYTDRATGRVQTWSSPRIIWFRKDDRVITEEVRGTGGR